MRKLIAKAGERVTDDQGATVCFVAVDIHGADRLKRSQFRDWTHGEPAQGDKLGPGFRTVPYGGTGCVQVCIEGEWR